MDRSRTDAEYARAVQARLANGTRVTNGTHAGNGSSGTNGTRGTNGTHVGNGTQVGNSVRGANGADHLYGANGIQSDDDLEVLPPLGMAADDHPSEWAPPPTRVRRPITGPQRIGAILLAAVCVLGVAWYIPKIVTADRHSFTGSVSSNGLSDLNFASNGRVGKIKVHLGQTVKPGQVLATESSPATTAVVSADRAAINADMANLAGLRAQGAKPGQPKFAAARAQLAKDRAQLASDRVKIVGTEIIAPAGGTVVAINGQTGETVTSGGVRNYSSQSQSSSAAQQPAFSLLPEGPKTSVTGSGSQTALPMLALRTAGGWQVKMLVPESAVSTIKVGQRASVSVPAVQLSNLKAYVGELSPTPVNTSSGTAYEVVINVVDSRRVIPLSGMTADVQLGQ